MRFQKYSIFTTRRNQNASHIYSWPIRTVYRVAALPKVRFFHITLIWPSSDAFFYSSFLRTTTAGLRTYTFYETFKFDYFTIRSSVCTITYTNSIVFCTKVCSTSNVKLTELFLAFQWGQFIPVYRWNCVWWQKRWNIRCNQRIGWL